MQEQMECSICWEVLSNRRILPCGHRFCAQCLQELVDHFDPILIWLFRGFPCPLCRTQVRLPDEIAQAFPRYAEMPDELVNISLAIEVSANDEAQGLSRRIEEVNRSANRTIAPKERCSPGYYCFAFVVLVIAFLVYTCAQYAYEAEKAEEACLSEKEGYAISEKRLRRQVQDLIDKEKRDSLQIERMQKYVDKIQYAKQPLLSKTFQLKPAESRAAVVLTLINGGLLVANSENGNLKLRDAYSVTKESDWATIPSATVAGMGLCLKNGNVFVSTWNKLIFRFNRNGEKLGQWAVEASSSGVISVTDDCNVVLAVRDNSKKILTYSIYGELIREIRMKTDILQSRLIKAMQLSNGHFLVSYGEGDDQVHGIEIIDANGQTQKSHGWRKGSGTGQLRDPRDFVVDVFGNVLVADSGNGRIILLDSQLKFQRELVSTEHGLNHPFGIVLDEWQLMYVADNKLDPTTNKLTEGKVMVFKIR